MKIERVDFEQATRKTIDLRGVEQKMRIGQLWRGVRVVKRGPMRDGEQWWHADCVYCAAELCVGEYQLTHGFGELCGCRRGSRRY
jgi:hypothetical protein